MILGLSRVLTVGLAENLALAGRGSSAKKEVCLLNDWGFRLARHIPLF